MASRSMAPLLPWSHYIAPGVIQTKDKAWLCGWSFEPINADLMEDEEVASMRDRIAAVFSSLRGRIAIWSEVSNVANQTSYTLFLSYYPIDDPSEEANFRGSIQSIANRLEPVLDGFEALDDLALLNALLRQVTPRGCEFSQMPSCMNFLDYLLASVELEGGAPPALDGQCLVAVVVTDPGRATDPRVVSELSELPFDLRATTRWLSMTADEGRRLIAGREAGFKLANFSWFGALMATFSSSSKGDRQSEHLVDEAESTAIEMQADGSSIGLVAHSVIILADDYRTAMNRATTVQSRFDKLGIVSRIETENAKDCFLGSLAGKSNCNVDNMPLFEKHYTSIAPFFGSSNGKPFGWLKLRNRAGNQVRVSLNERGNQLNVHVGHTAIIGKTGGGKSVVIGKIVYDFLHRHPDGSILMVDRGRSSRGWCRDLGGNFIDKVEMQPLHRDPDFAIKFIHHCITARGAKRTPALDLKIAKAVQEIFKKHPTKRTLAAAAKIMPELEYYVGGIFDGSEPDAIERRVTVFEIGDWTREIVGLGVLVLMDWIQRQLETITGPKLIIIDEAWLALKVPELRDAIDDMLRTLRKYNAAVIFATQDAADILASGYAHSLVSQTSTRIFVPHREAAEPAQAKALNALGLTPRVITALARAKEQSEYLVVQGRHRIIGSLDMTEHELARILEGGTPYGV